MKVLLAAINAKYIHSNLAIHSIKAYTNMYGYSVETVEYTINQPVDELLGDLYKRQPDVLCFSCYLWNISYEMCIRDRPYTKQKGPAAAPRLAKCLPRTVATTVSTTQPANE